MSELKKVTHTFLSGRLSATLIIPIETARKYGLDRPANVIIEETNDGILIRKLEILRGTKNVNAEEGRKVATVL